MAAPAAVVPGTPDHLNAHREEEALEKRRTRQSKPADPSQLGKLNRGSFYAFGLPPPCAAAPKHGASTTEAAAGEGAQSKEPLVKKQALPNASLVGLADLRKANAKVKGHPHPPHSAFRFFLEHYVKSVSQTADNQQKLMKAVKVEAKEKWSKLSESKAARFLELAKADKERYGAEKEHFKQAHPDAVKAAKAKTKRGRGAAGKAGKQKGGVEGDNAQAVKNTKQRQVKPESATVASGKKKADGEQLLQDGEEARSGSDSDEEGGVGYRSECSSDGDYLSASSEDERALPQQRLGTRHSERTATQQAGKAAETNASVGKQKLAKDRPRVKGQEQKQQKQQKRDVPEEGRKEGEAAGKGEQQKQKKRAVEEAEEAAGQGGRKQKRQRKEEAAAQAPALGGKGKRRVESEDVAEPGAASAGVDSPEVGVSQKRRGKAAVKAAAATDAGRTDPKPRSVAKVASKAAKDVQGDDAAENADEEDEAADIKKSRKASSKGGARVLRSRG